MYTNPQDYAKVKRRVAELYREHEKDLNEVNLLSYIQMVAQAVKCIIGHT